MREAPPDLRQKRASPSDATRIILGFGLVPATGMVARARDALASQE